jgi:hypothetical protein
MTKLKTPMTERAAMRAIISLAIAALAIAALGVWLLLSDRPRLNADQRLREQRESLVSKIEAAEQRIASVSVLIPPEEEKVVKTEELIRQLEKTQSTWDMFIRHRAQQRANNERLASLRALNATTIAKVAELQQQLARARWERDNHEIERTRIESQLRVIDAGRASASYQVRRAWLTVRAWLCLGVSVFLLGPVMLPLVIEQRRRRKEGVTVGGGAG